MNITILSVSAPVATVNGTKKYSTIEVAYKGEDGKVAGKKIVSFAQPAVYNILVDAKSGEVYSVVSEKVNDYWTWTSVKKGSESPSTSTTNTVGRSLNTSPKSTYETPEERAKKQVYIVRQSSLSNAIEYSKSIKALKTKEEVVELAKFFEGYVFDSVMADLSANDVVLQDEDFPT